MMTKLIAKKKLKACSLSLMIGFLLLSSFSLLFFSSSCRLYNIEKKLDPVNAEFLSKVRYIITRKERKIFLELPDTEKEEFIEEFWKRRDFDPDTEENEFKMEYFDRIEQSSDLFVGEGRPGWLTDRGRIYILFGPPDIRETHHIESTDPYSLFYRRCGELWHYGMFPVVFFDNTCTGNSYRLVTYDLTSLRSINLMYMHELSKAQAEAQITFKREKKLFDFDLSVKKNVVETNRIEGIITIEIPYDVIWYRSEEGRLVTTIEVHLELKDFADQLFWEYKDAFTISMEEGELKEKQKKKYTVEIPFVFEKDLDRLHQGKNRLFCLLKNRTGDEETKKVIEFKL